LVDDVRLRLFEEVAVSDNGETKSALAELTLEQIIERCNPMGNLDELLIGDLTSADEDKFFGILEGA
jgi:hypothetical protein